MRRGPCVSGSGWGGRSVAVAYLFCYLHRVGIRIGRVAPRAGLVAILRPVDVGKGADPIGASANFGSVAAACCRPPPVHHQPGGTLVPLRPVAEHASAPEYFTSAGPGQNRGAVVGMWLWLVVVVGRGRGAKDGREVAI